jgi:hypothetical protein
MLSNPLRLSLRVFALFTGIYLCTWAGHYTTGDGSYKIAWAKVMLLGDAAGVAPGQNGVYSKYGIGQSLLAVPPLALAHFIQNKTGIHLEAALYTLMFVFNGALFLALVAFYLAHFFPDRSVWWTVLIAGLATSWWPYTKMDFSEPLVLTVVFLGFVLMRFGYPVGGVLVAGFALAIRSDAVAIVGPMILWYLLANRSIRAVVKVTLSLAPSIALVLFANYIRYHSLLDLGYAGETFSNPFLVGFYGILLSSGKSIFLFSPPLLLGAWGWKKFVRNSDTGRDAWLFLSICGAQALLFAKWWDWSSDDAWGVRFLLPGVLLMCIPMITVLDRRAFVILVAVAGVAVQLLAVSVGGLDFIYLLRSIRPQRQALYVGGTNQIDFEDLRFDPNYSQIVGHWILVRYLLHIPPRPSQTEDAARVGTRLYDAISPREWAAAARWDFAWSIRRSKTGDASRIPAAVGGSK